MLEYFIEYNRYLNIVGLGLVLAIAALCSSHRKKISLKLIGSALLLELGIGLFVLKTSLGTRAVECLAAGVQYLYLYAQEGNKFVFGSLAQNAAPWGTVFAVQILPLIIFFGAFMSLLFHLGVVQKFVGAVNYLLRPLLGTSGAETTCAIANSFLGQTEAPLLIKNYLKTMSRSEILVVMVSGMGTISGAILAVFSSMGVPARHLLASSVMSIPVTIMIAKILEPEVEKQHETDVQLDQKATTSNVFDALSVGTSDGLYLALNVGAMLIAFIALMAMTNGFLGALTAHINKWLGLALPVLSLDLIFSKLFYPFAYVLGFTGEVASDVAELLGTKVAINEFLAYWKMQSMHLPARAEALATYALCGFSNFSCIGIQVGGIGALVPEKRKVLTQLGLKAVLGGALSNIFVACVAGILL